ncbi:uncharacterized protein [Typha angustifolia]|uniref:uncharacterized protein n=1 Tax=Typha angustifolia TaxID=59011 RepID=UPI003C2F76DB
MPIHHHLLLLVYLILLLSVIAIQTLAAYPCIEVEREALLTFKASISDGIRHSLSSWDEAQDCCRWRGVVCDNTTTHNILELNLGNPFDWYSQHINWTDYALSGLTTLDLSDNWQFNTTLPHWLWNLTDLSYLNLEDSQFHGKIPNALGNFTSLTYLYLGYNNLEGPLPKSIGKLCNLRGIDLSYLGIGGDIRELVEMLGCKWNNMEEIILSSNNLQGNLSNWLEEMPNLKHLDLNNNFLVGPVSLEIGSLQNLNFLDLSSNFLHGVISEAHFANLTKLNQLQLSSNSLIISVDRSWNPPFQLISLALGSGRVGPQFPAWLRWQRQINEVDLYNTSITSTLPHWLWSLPISPLPSLPDGLSFLDLSNNFISGPLPKLLLTSITYLSLSNNSISGSIPSSICEPTILEVLDLSTNHLSGELPRCWLQGSWLFMMDLSNNNITGEIPPSMGSLTSLQSLDLNRNNLYGELPSELQHCKNLFLLDLGNNNFSGNIPIWIGEKLLNLRYLQLCSNMFDGNIPPQLAQLTALQVLDLSSNKLFGSIPRSFGNFTEMMISSSVRNDNEYFSWVIDIDIFTYMDKLLLAMDLSGNNLSGVIPEEIGVLRQLNSLNLSKNHLIGRIPEKIFDILFLESLDLSSNELSGRIRSGNQLDTLNDPSIYIGNAYLCGPPTSKNCSGDTAASNSTSNYANGSETSMWWLYLGTGVGFVAGFWGVYAVLLFHGTWSGSEYE